MRLCALQSGSNGNCVYVEAGGVRLLIDAGISGRLAGERLAERGLDAHGADALLISHDHIDHSRCAGVFHRRFGAPVFATAATFDAVARHTDLGRLSGRERFAAGDRLRFGPVTVETVATAHDGADGVGFVVEHGGKRLGVLTDLGHAFEGLADMVRSLDGVLLESNYDPAMLAGGPYPAFLKRRIAGPGGHLSNGEAAALVAGAATAGRLGWACLGHLSAENNTPELALETARAAVGPGLPLHLAGRHGASPVIGI
jgi:phosphoribosyl 1,2-cyclic phosphodiesterase